MFIIENLENILKSIKIILNNSAFKDNHISYEKKMSISIFINITTILLLSLFT